MKAQGGWGAYSQKIDVKRYAGHAIKFSAWIRAEIDDDLAGACLWVRVDKEKGVGFVDDMQNRPVRSNEWKEYVIEGKINADGLNLAFGAFCLLNGKFYYDNLKLEVETDKGKWTTLFATDFEDGKNNLIEGFSRNDLVSNSNYKAEVIALQRNKSKKCLLITGKGVPNYGSNKVAGKFADVNGIKLYYEIYGEGAPLLVLHGNGGSIADAGNFYPELIKKYKVIAID
ncbi:MAG TPA: hypothetical protein VN698_08805, partial [Bacteroidia bacterium]|nr:hypothetical protein [Bacteroidia bacterium]